MRKNIFQKMTTKNGRKSYSDPTSLFQSSGTNIPPHRSWKNLLRRWSSKSTKNLYLTSQVSLKLSLRMKSASLFCPKQIGAMRLRSHCTEISGHTQLQKIASKY